MKIAYFIVWYDGPHSGVGKKVQDQIAAWKTLGHDAKIFILTSKSHHSGWTSCMDVDTVLVETNKLDKYLCRRKILANVKNWDPDILYMREAFPIGSIKKFCSKTTTVLEINSDASRELRNRSLIKYVVNFTYRRHYYFGIHACVFVSNELKDSSPSFMKRKPNLVVGNGIDFSRVPWLSPVGTSDRIKLIFIGTQEHYWGGIEQIFELAKLRPHFVIHVIGIDADNTFDNLPNVIFHGKLEQEKYHKIASECTAGLSTLSLGKKGMREASPLKSREYLALGLPIITRYRDTDFHNSEDFILTLPLDSLSVAEEIHAIDVFLEKWRGRRVNRDEISQISILEKEFFKLDFFEELRKSFGKSRVNGDKLSDWS